MKIHTKIRTLTMDGGSILYDKIDLVHWLKDNPELANYFFAHMDNFFEVAAHLEAPGTALQPTGTGTATWTGKAIAGNYHKRDLLLRGDLIGGDAQFTVTFASGSTTATLSLTNMTSTLAGSGGDYDAFTSGSMAVTNGSFSVTGTTGCAGCSVSGTFRDQDRDSDTGTSIADTVGGGFDETNDPRGGYRGGFVAAKD